MIGLFKKLICTAAVIAVSALSVFAAGTGIKINAGKEFTVLLPGENEKELASILGITEDELIGYCRDNGIEYLAVNRDNTKQIRLSVKQTEFSSAVINFSNLSDENIAAVIPEIIGVSNVKCETADKNGQKFAKVCMSSSDSGGEYTVSQYITVANKRLFILSVCTAADKNTDYADKVFEGFDSEDFNHTKSQKNGYNGIIVGAIAILVVVCAFVAVTLVRDIRSDYAVKNGDNDCKEET